MREDDIAAARPYIEAALEYAGGTHTVDDVLTDIRAGRLQLWPAPGSALVTEIVDYPQKRILNCFLAGGNLVELEIMAPVIEDFARSQGCTAVTLVGRRGWERTFLATRGYDPIQVVYQRDL